MELESLLSEKKEEIIKEWFDMAVQAYPPDASEFLRKQANRFANPIGYNISNAMEAALDHLSGRKKAEEVVEALDGLVKMKAVQDFSASQAVSFIFLLKEILRKHAGGDFESLLALETRIDHLALACFDLYMRDREKLYALKASEFRNMNFRLLEKAGLAGGMEGPVCGGNGS